MSPEDARAVTEAMETYASGLLEIIRIELAPPLVSPLKLLRYDARPILPERD